MFPGVLKTFYDVVQAGSISRAGKNLNLAPSSVSRQIAILERQIGTALFKRSIDGVELTHAGSLVAEYAHSVIRDFDSLRSELNDLQGLRRLIRVTMVESIVSGGPAEAVRRFTSNFKLVSFEFRVAPAPMVVDAIKTNQCEIGISFCAAPDPAVETIAQIHEPIVVLLPVDHPMAHACGIELSQLAGLPLALPDHNFGIRRTFDNVCRSEGLSYYPVMQSNSFEALRDFVRVGGGAAVLPKRAALIAQQTGGLHVVPLNHNIFKNSTLDILVLKQRRVPRIIRAFVDTLTASIEADHGLDAKTSTRLTAVG
jgi:DNA-binding transcriptional LysR family regulator